MYPIILDLKRKVRPVDYEDKDLRTVFRRDATSTRQLTSPCSCDSRYMTSLLVFRENKPSGSCQCLNKIEAALKVLTFREPHVLVQFWWPHEVGIGKHQLLTNIDQPFGLGVDDEGLRSYRQVSTRKDHEEEDCSPAARVFRLGFPEWSFDLNNYTLKQFPQKEYAKRCNFHGYLSLPVFDSTTKLFVGVLELLTTLTTYTSYAYEVKNIHDALKKVNLTSPQGFDFPALYVPDERKQKDHDKIFRILKMMCNIHSVPLAQTWAVSQHTSFVCHEKMCGLSSFREACRVRHLDWSCCFVGKALLTRGSCFCGDVTKLSEEEYPLVHNARMNRLTSCFVILLHSVEANDDYALEFFLPPDIKDSGLLLDLVQTLKQSILKGSGFVLGDTSIIQVVGPPTDLSVSMGSDVTQTSSDSVPDTFTSSDSESMMAAGSSNLSGNSSVEKTCVTSTDAGEKSEQGKKHKRDAAVTGMVTELMSYRKLY